MRDFLEKHWWVWLSLLVVCTVLGIPIALHAGEPDSPRNPGTLLIVVAGSLCLAFVDYRATMESIRADYFGNANAAAAKKEIAARRKTLAVSTLTRVMGIAGSALAVLWVVYHHHGYSNYKDWEQWETEIAEAADRCAEPDEKNPKTEDAKCLKSLLEKRPPTTEGSPSVQLLRDLMAGNFYLTVPRLNT